MEREWLENMIPEDESCFDGWIPENMVSENGEMRIKIADGLATMPKLFFDTNRLLLFSYLNQCLRDGRLRREVGFSFTNRVINKSVCYFTGWDFWRINRENFFTYVYVTLTLTTADGPRIWKGYLELWCSFEGEFECTVEDFGPATEMVEEEPRIRLSPFLVPYMYGNELDRECESILNDYLPGSIMNPKERSAVKLAEKYGLSIQYLPVHDEYENGSILFFAAGKLLVKEGKLRKHMCKMERAKDDAANPPEEVDVQANTIVVNTNVIEKEYAAYSIFHECIHYEYHYLFFRLQRMYNNDFRKIKTKTIVIKPGDKITDPLYWMEKQANRGAYGLMLPITWMREQVAKEISQVKEYRHLGELFDIIGRKICARNKIANFRMRARLIQMGNIEAKGSLNWLIGGIRVTPFAFDRRACEKIEETFIIDKYESGHLYEKNEGFRKIFDTGKFIWADGHVVRNDSRYVREMGSGYMLTPWANAHVDQCCLRFLRVYIPGGMGKYVFGRMNFDADYVAKTMFFLEDSANQGVLNEMEAEQKYADEFPENFWDGLKQLMDRAGVTQEKMVEKMDMPIRTFQRWFEQRKEQVSIDFVMMASLALELPDWLSNLLLDRAGLALSDRIPRHLALKWIQRAQWKDGIEKANDYLKQRKYGKLKYKES